MTFYLAFYYIMTFITLSGLGVVFLNAESILALCFFIFLALIIQNVSMDASLEEQKQAIKAELISCMIAVEKHNLCTKKLLCYKKAQLLSSLPHVTNI